MMLHIEFPQYLVITKDWYILTAGKKHVVRTEIVVSVQCEFKTHDRRKQVTEKGPSPQQ